MNLLSKIDELNKIILFENNDDGEIFEQIMLEITTPIIPIRKSTNCFTLQILKSRFNYLYIITSYCVLQGTN